MLEIENKNKKLRKREKIHCHLRKRYCVTVRDDEDIICKVWKLQWTGSYFCWSPIWAIILLHRDKNMLLSYDIANTYIALDGHAELDCHKAIPPKQQSSSRICRTTLIHYSDSEPISRFLLLAMRRSNTYNLYCYWFYQTGDWTVDLQRSRWAQLNY